VHRLVQAVTRTPDPTDPHRQPADIATARYITEAILADALAGPDAHNPADWPAYRMVLPLARALLEHTTPDTDTTWTSRLLNALGRYLSGQGDLDTAIAPTTPAPPTATTASMALTTRTRWDSRHNLT